MPDINLVKKGMALYPALDQDTEYFLKLKQGEIVRAKLSKPRNIKHHAKYFAMLQVVFENQDKYELFEDLLIELKLKCGHYQEHITTKGKIVYVPKSISFAKMDQLKFEKFYDKSVDICIQHFCEGSTENEIKRKVLDVINFT